MLSSDILTLTNDLLAIAPLRRVHAHLGHRSLAYQAKQRLASLLVVRWLPSLRDETLSVEASLLSRTLRHHALASDIASLTVGFLATTLHLMLGAAH